MADLNNKTEYAFSSTKETLQKNIMSWEDSLAKHAHDPMYLLEWRAKEMVYASLSKRYLFAIENGEKNGSSKEVILSWLGKEAANAMFRTVMNSSCPASNVAGLYAREFHERLLELVLVVSSPGYTVGEALFPSAG